MTIGEIYKHPDFYRNETGSHKKYLLVLGVTAGQDVVFRLLTSRPHGRPREPRCNHGNPYPSFYLDTANDLMPQPTWLDLRASDDYDGDEFSTRLHNSQIAYLGLLPKPLLCEALTCVAAADDTTFAQEQTMRDARALLECP